MHNAMFTQQLLHMHSSSHGIQSKIAAAALTLMAVTIWLLLRGYHGLVGDGQLYAFQALAWNHPHLRADLYLQNTSQDQFTIFSPIYAWFIGFLGLENAARLLTLTFTAWFLGAAWRMARTLTGTDGAWLAVALLLIASGSYGASRVFQFSEQFLTARLPAEALVVTSLVCYLGGHRRLGVALATAALFVHPLIALPGLLFLICLSVPTRVSIIGAVACVIAAWLISYSAMHFPQVSHGFALMDPTWLNIVQERSQFLFLQLWSSRDWELNVRPFFYLWFIWTAVQDVRIRKVCSAAGIVAAAGLAVAFIASALGPVAILVQGQAWRWVWIAALIGTLLLPATILQIRQDKEFGALCAILLISGLTLPAINGTACVSLAIVLWMTRSRVITYTRGHTRWINVALILAAGFWIFAKSLESLAHPIQTSAGVATTQVVDIFGLRFFVTLVAGLLWWSIRNSRTAWPPTLLCGVLLAVSTYILPVAFKQSRALASVGEIAEFTDWENAIPPTSTVLITPSRDVGTFVWFTLQRPNYLAVDQSAGVVFSRTTALEVQRRSQVLLPVMDPNWKILSGLRAATRSRAVNASSRPLNEESLRQICGDPELGFVISPEHIGIEPLTHETAGFWMGWNLYNCSNVRSLPASTR
jgi:hypothetical protein